ncbi:MAG: hypothetical protein Q8Q24_02080 [bacterium]|nr:hypothetical protein [bacterium]
MPKLLSIARNKQSHKSIKSFFKVPFVLTAITILLAFLFVSLKNSSIYNWKTLEAYDFSIKYPNTWISEGAGEGCGPVIRPPKEKDYWVTICPFKKESDSLLEGQILIVSPKEVTVDDFKGESLTIREPWGIFAEKVYVASKEGVAEEIIAYSYSENLLKQYKRTFDLMVSSFKFLSETADWNTYSNKPLNLVINYPSEVTLEKGGIPKGEIGQIRLSNNYGYMYVSNNSCMPENPSLKIHDVIRFGDQEINRYKLQNYQGYNLYRFNFLNGRKCLGVDQGFKPSKEPETKAIFDKIFSTFRYLDSTKL